MILGRRHRKLVQFVLRSFWPSSCPYFAKQELNLLLYGTLLQSELPVDRLLQSSSPLSQAFLLSAHYQLVPLLATLYPPCLPLPHLSATHPTSLAALLLHLHLPPPPQPQLLLTLPLLLQTRHKSIAHPYSPCSLHRLGSTQSLSWSYHNSGQTYQNRDP